MKEYWAPKEVIEVSPMSKYEPIRFYFHATGYALSGHFHRPVEVPIPAQASLALPSEGGHAYSRVECFDVPRIAFFKSAHTHVSGSWQDENTATTSVTVVVEGLRILDFLSVDRMVTRVTSEYKFDKKNSESTSSLSGAISTICALVALRSKSRFVMTCCSSPRLLKI